MIEANDGSERAWPQGHNSATPRYPKAAKGHVYPPVFTLQSDVKQSYYLHRLKTWLGQFSHFGPRIVALSVLLVLDYGIVAGSTTNNT
jgi:hypothetical protein